MAEPADQEIIRALLLGLHSDEAMGRQAAAERIARQGTQSEQIVERLKTLADGDVNLGVRREAQAALKAIAENDPEGVLRQGAQTGRTGNRLAVPTPGPAAPLASDQVIRRFLIGFVGWWVVNGIVYGVVGFSPTSSNEIILLCVLPYMFLANITTVIALAFIWKHVALGMLTAFALNLLVSLVLGLLTTAICFVPFFYAIR